MRYKCPDCGGKILKLEYNWATNKYFTEEYLPEEPIFTWECSVCRTIGNVRDLDGSPYCTARRNLGEEDE